MLAGINEDLALPLLTARPILTPSAKAHESIKRRRVMVTGAGGSIGSELVKQIIRSQPASLILVDHSEYNLYEINCTVANQAEPVPSVSYLMDVRAIDEMRYAFFKQKPEIVFHAAALKHVPMRENDFNLAAAVRTNVGGTRIVADLCAATGADMVLISTDKAVNPSSGMGLTKRVAEIYLYAKAGRHPDVRFSQVRFGNVLGSSGSVVPLFRRQIAQGGPVTITHPEMTRYMMTISEAVGLTLCASDLPQKGYGLYVLDMGKPVKIIDLARQLIEMAGLRPHTDIPIDIVGMRPGEKLFEELSYDWEQVRPTSVPGVMLAHPVFDPKPVLGKVDELLMAANARDHEQVKSLLVEIVPEYVGEVTF